MGNCHAALPQSTQECFAANVGYVKVASGGVPLSPVVVKTTKGMLEGPGPPPQVRLLDQIP